MKYYINREFPDVNSTIHKIPKKETDRKRKLHICGNIFTTTFLTDPSCVHTLIYILSWRLKLFNIHNYLQKSFHPFYYILFCHPSKNVFKRCAPDRSKFHENKINHANVCATKPIIIAWRLQIYAN